MAIVYPATPAAEPRWYDRLQTHPVAAFAGILILGLLVGFLISKLRGTSASAATTATSSNASPDVLYYPTQNTFENINTTSDSYNQTTTNNPPPSSGGSSGGLQFPLTAKVRASTGSSFDKKYGGVYLFSTPATGAFGGHSLSTVPFGSAITLFSETQGSPYASGESDTNWFQTSGGYISEHDVILPSTPLLAPGPGGLNPGTGMGGLSVLDWLRSYVPILN